MHNASANNHPTSPLITKLKKVAPASAGKRLDYAPTVGAEHCPVCWSISGLGRRLRTEPHQNADRVFVAVCDSCGTYVVP